VSGAPPGLAIEPDHLVRLDPASGEVLASYEVGSNPGGVAISGGAVWVLNDGDLTISKVDMATGHVTTRGGFQSPCDVYPAPGGGVWVGSCDLGAIQRVDPHSFEVVQSIPVENPGAVVNTDGSVWAVSYQGSAEPSILYRFTPSGRRLAKITLGLQSWAVAVSDDGSLWGNDYGDGTIWHVDPDTNTAVFVDGWTGPDNVVADGHYLWISDEEQDSVTQYDHVTGQTVGVVRDHSGSIVVTPDAVWIQEGFGDTLTRVDPDTGQIVEEFQLGYSTDMVSGGGSLWITAGTD
jgi:streptogramin lyase